MSPRPPESRWATLGQLVAMAVTLVAPLRWLERVVERPTSLIVIAAAIVAAVVCGRLSEDAWVLRAAIAVGAGVVAALLAGGLAGVWILVAVVFCDWAVRGRRPLPPVPASGAAAAPVAALSLVAMWLAGYPGTAIFILMLLAAAVLVTPLAALVEPSAARLVGAIRPVGAVALGAVRDRSTLWWAAILGTSLWVAGNLVWFQVHRGARLWDHEEITYTQLVSYFAAGEGNHPLSGLFIAHYGPMQALLGAPFQWIFGIDQATVIYLNIGLTATTGLVAFWMVRRLADPAAGLVALALVLLTPGMLENARGALTMVPATTFAVAALAALVAGRGMRRWQWAVVGGIAVGCMSLSRPMSIAFLPGLAVPAIVWSLRTATPWRTILRNGALAGLAAALAAGWWWAISMQRVMDYLSSGAEGVATGSVVEVLDNRIYELSAYIGPIAFGRRLGYTWILALVAFVVFAGAATVLRSRRSVADGVTATSVRAPESGGPAASPSDHVDLPLWPLWAAAGVNVAVSLASNTIGWLLLPLVPWMIIAAVAGARRLLPPWAFGAWSAVVVVPVAVVAVATSTFSVTPGNRFTWCMEPWQTTSACAVDDRTEAAEWKRAVRQITDESIDLRSDLRDDSDEEVPIAIVARDHLLLGASIRFQAWLDHHSSLGTTTFVSDLLAMEPRLEELERQAGVIVVVPDGEPTTLFPSMVDPDELPVDLVEHGFVACRDVDLPDGRVVQLFVQDQAPSDVCS